MLKHPKYTFYMLLIIIFLSLTCNAALAEPAIQSVTGIISQGETIVIEGIDFGIKSPAAPVLWDDGSDNTKLNTYYSEALPSAAEEGNTYNMQYRDSTFLSSRSVSPPPSSPTYVLAGAHACDGRSDYTSGNNVSLLVTPSGWSSGGGAQPKFYINYYYRVDPGFDEENNASYGDNMKELCISGDDNEIYGDNRWGYATWCINKVPDVNYTNDDITIERNPIDPNNQSLPYGCSGNNLVGHYNPINSWVKMEWVGDYDTNFDNPSLTLRLLKNGVGQNYQYQDHYGDAMTTYETLYGFGYPDNSDYKSIGIGGYARTPRENYGVNSYRYFASVYVDITPARVMIGDAQDYDSCTILEPQIPVSWDQASITVNCNLASIPDGKTAYLFVFDSENNHNPVGYQVTVEASTAGDGTTTVASMPTNLRILQSDVTEPDVTEPIDDTVNTTTPVVETGSCGDTLITGFDDDLSSWGTFWNYWKGFQATEVSQSGDANCLKVRVYGFANGTDGEHTSSQVGYALYSDNNGEVGTLLASGYREGYNWEEIGAGLHTFTFDIVYTTRQLEAGEKYWIMMISPDTEVFIERNGSNPEINRPRRGASSTNFRNPPPGNEFTTVFGDGGYSWSIW